MDLLNVIVYGLCIFSFAASLKGETLAVKGVWFDVKLHNREDGSITQWIKHTKESPRSWFYCQKVWRR